MLKKKLKSAKEKNNGQSAAKPQYGGRSTTIIEVSQ